MYHVQVHPTQVNIGAERFSQALFSLYGYITLISGGTHGNEQACNVDVLYKLMTTHT